MLLLGQISDTEDTKTIPGADTCILFVYVPFLKLMLLGIFVKTKNSS